MPTEEVMEKGGSISSKIFKTKQKVYTDLRHLSVDVAKKDLEKGQKIHKAADNFYEDMPEFKDGGEVKESAKTRATKRKMSKMTAKERAKARRKK